MMEKTAPAFQFYASDTMADKRYRMMSLGERGLFISLLCECWVNRSVPADPDGIGKWLGFPSDEVQGVLTERVKSFFQEKAGELTSAELERYRAELEERRSKMSKGGRKGARTKWSNSPAKDINPISHPNGSPSRGSMGPRVELSRDEKSRSESLGKEGIPNHDSWVSDYDKASNGY